MVRYCRCLSQQEKWAAPSNEGSKLIARLSVKQSSDGIIATANMRPKEVFPPRLMHLHAHSLAVSHLAPFHYWLSSVCVDDIRVALIFRMLAWHCFETRSHRLPFFPLSTLMSAWSLETWLPVFTLFLKHAACIMYENTLEYRDNCGCSETKWSLCVHSATHPHGQFATSTHVSSRLSSYIPPTRLWSFSNTTNTNILSFHPFGLDCVPGNAPVGFDLQYCWVVRVVELHLGVPQLCKVNVHHHRSAADRQTRWSHTHNLPCAAPGARTHTHAQVITHKQTLERKGNNL